MKVGTEDFQRWFFILGFLILELKISIQKLPMKKRLQMRLLNFPYGFRIYRLHVSQNVGFLKRFLEISRPQICPCMQQLQPLVRLHGQQ